MRPAYIRIKLSNCLSYFLLMAYVTCINHVGGRRSTYGVRKLFSALCKRPKWNEETDCRTKYEQLEWFEPKRKTHNCRLNCQTNWPTHIVKDQIYVAASSRFPLHQIRKKKTLRLQKNDRTSGALPTYQLSNTHTHSWWFTFTLKGAESVFDIVTRVFSPHRAPNFIKLV